VKLTSAVKTLISGATNRYTTFTLIVAQRYHRNLQRPPQLLIKPKETCIKTLKNFLVKLMGQGPSI
jgi:hypothetical protein